MSTDQYGICEHKKRKERSGCDKMKMTLWILFKTYKAEMNGISWSWLWYSMWILSRWNKIWLKLRMWMSRVERNDRNGRENFYVLCFERNLRADVKDEETLILLIISDHYTFDDAEEIGFVFSGFRGMWKILHIYCSRIKQKQIAPFSKRSKICIFRKFHSNCNGISNP